jgi:hypothetical protein
MKTYAYIYSGIVWQIIAPVQDSGGNETPLADRFSPEFVAACVDITNVTPRPSANWTYNWATFSAPS